MTHKHIRGMADPCRVGVDAERPRVAQPGGTKLDDVGLRRVQIAHQDIEVHLLRIRGIWPPRRLPTTVAEAERSLDDPLVEGIQRLVLTLATADADPEAALPDLGGDGNPEHQGLVIHEDRGVGLALVPGQPEPDHLVVDTPSIDDVTIRPGERLQPR